MEQEQQVHVLQFVTGKYAGEEFPLPPGRHYVVGRSSEADLVLADDVVSRKHARFFHARDRIWVRDLGSRNGTYVNGGAITQHCLRVGDRLGLGASLIRVAVYPASEVRRSSIAGERSRTREESQGRSMSGSLEDIPLADVLQWLAQSRKTGKLKVRAAEQGKGGALDLREGQVYFASITGAPELHPQKALLRMLAWEKGMFELENGQPPSPVEVEIKSSLEHMLMEAARVQDELNHLGTRVALPRPGSKIVVRKPSPVRWRELSVDELDLLQDLVDGKDFWRVLDASPTDDVTFMRMVSGLAERGLLDYG